MNYSDPARPLMPSGRPFYLSPSGKPIAALVIPQIEISAPGEYRLYWWLLIASNVARPFTIDTEAPWPIIEDFLSRPEDFLREKFNYAYEPMGVKISRPVGRPSKSEFNLEDIGL